MVEHAGGVAHEWCSSQQALKCWALDVEVLGFLHVEQDLELPWNCLLDDQNRLLVRGPEAHPERSDSLL
eukprot:1029407-Rhodomonas_salina.1